MTNVESAPVTELNDNELRSASEQLFLVTSDGEVQDYLRALNLPQVAGNYAVSPQAAYERLVHIRATAAQRLLAAQVVYARSDIGSGDGREVIGMSTLLPGLALRRQPVDWWPRLARLIPCMSQRRPGGDVNAVAWTDPRRQDWRSEATVAQASLLHPSVLEQLPESGAPDRTFWRIVPRAMTESDVYDWGSIMLQAGFRYKTDGYFDDKSTKGRLPYSELFVGRMALTAAI